MAVDRYPKTTAEINIPVDTLKKVGPIPNGFAISIKALIDISHPANFEMANRDRIAPINKFAINTILFIFLLFIK